MLTRICITVASAPQIVSLQCYTNIYIEILCLVDHKDKVTRFLRGLSLVYRVWGTWCKTWQWWQSCLWTPGIVSHITDTKRTTISVSCEKQPHFVWVVIVFLHSRGKPEFIVSVNLLIVFRKVTGNCLPHHSEQKPDNCQCQHLCRKQALCLCLVCTYLQMVFLHSCGRPRFVVYQSTVA